MHVFKLAALWVQGVIAASVLWGTPGVATAVEAEAPLSSRYLIRNLGRPPSTPGMIASGVNNLGMVTGYASRPRLGARAFLYQDGQLGLLGTLPGTDVFSYGYAINDQGVVAGESNSRPVVFRDGRVIDLLSGAPGTWHGASTAINAAGMVTGTIDTGNETAFLYDGTHARPLAIDGLERSWGRDINDAGDVLIAADPGGLRAGGYVYSQGHATALPRSDSGEGFDPVSFGAAGQVVGNFNALAGKRAAVYSDGHYQMLGEPTDHFEAIAANDRGWVLLHGVRPGHDSINYLYRNGRIEVLQDLLLPWGEAKWGSSLRAFGLSDRGDVVGWGIYNGRMQSAFLATPVPEPGALALMLAGLGLWVPLRAGAARTCTREHGSGLTRLVHRARTDALHAGLPDHGGQDRPGDAPRRNSSGVMPMRRLNMVMKAEAPA